MKFQFMQGKHSTFNIQRPMSNRPETFGSFDVGCSMLNVECSSVFSFSQEEQP
jgi:hypothetical protein